MEKAKESFSTASKQSLRIIVVKHIVFMATSLLIVKIQAQFITGNGKNDAAKGTIYFSRCNKLNAMIVLILQFDD